MTLERWGKIDELVDAAMDLEPAERLIFLQEKCQEDQSLLVEVKNILESKSVSGGILNSAAREKIFEDFFEEEDPESLVGSEIGRHKIERFLGKGGYGFVYYAQHIFLTRFDALKVLYKQYSVSESYMQKFEEEAILASQLKHENIVTIYDYGKSANIQFIAMEYIEGETLRRRMKNKPLTISEIIKIAINITQGLKEAHNKKIIHRDIKPENIIIQSESNIAKILDFGIAKFVGEIDTGNRKKSEGKQSKNKSGIVGTPHYMSPEQVRGDPTDTQTDIWSLGVVLYEMVNGERPFYGRRERDVLDAILKNTPKLPTSKTSPVPRELRNIIDKSLAKDKSQRYKTVEEVYKALVRFEQRRKIKRILKPAIVPSVFILIIALIIGFAVHNKNKTETLAKNLLVKARNIVEESPHDLDQAMLIAMESDKRVTSIDAYTIIHDALVKRGSILKYFKQPRSVETDPNSYRSYSSGRQLPGVIPTTFSPDGKFITLAEATTDVIVWDLETDKNKLVIIHDTVPYLTSFSLNNRYLATADQKKAKLTDIKTEKTVEIPAQLQGVWRIILVEFSPDSRYLAVLNLLEQTSTVMLTTGQKISSVADTDQKIQIFETENLKLVAEIDFKSVLGSEGMGTFIPKFNKVVFSPDSKTIAARTGMNHQATSFLKIWDVKTGKELSSIEHNARITDVTFSPSGKMLATGCEDGIARIFKASDSNLMMETEPLTSTFPWVDTVAFSSDEKLLATGEEDEFVKIWKIGDGKKPLFNLPHENAVTQVEFMDNDKYLVSSTTMIENDDASAIRVWNMESGKLVSILPYHSNVNSFSISPDQKMIASSDYGGESTVWQPFRNPFEVTSQTADRISKFIGISNNSRYYSKLTNDRLLQVFEVKTDKLIAESNSFENIKSAVPSEDAQKVYLEIEKDKLDKRQVSIWDTKTNEIKEIAAKEKSTNYNSVQIGLPDLIYLDVNNSNYDFLVTNPFYGISQNIIEEELISDISFTSNNGRYFCYYTKKNNLKIWDINNEQFIMKTEMSKREFGFSIDNNGKYMAFASDGKLSLKRVSKNLEVAFEYATDKKIAITFSQNSDYLAIKEENLIKIFQIESSREVARFMNPTNDSTSINFTENDELALVNKEFLSVLRWKPDEVFSQVCTTVWHNLMPSEWNTALPDEKQTETCPQLVPKHPF